MTERSEHELESIALRLAAYRSEYGTGEEKWALRVCELAWQASLQGNYGVGAVLVDGQGDLLAEGSNQVFEPVFNSSAHAEMKVLDLFEAVYPDYHQRVQLSLFTSLEPCPMCCGRILAAGIGRVVYLSEDKEGGMMSHCTRLPAAWKNLSQLLEIKVFDKEHELSVLASDIATAQKIRLRHKLMAVIRP
ncbi:nucleoside deaminase [uncultured Neptuniibacter sp.]|uniref:nucleoside deaminase n=1 Tax=uncultured Neptuniibacter sp. TaxID=502143 RepID=UPI002616C36E|nr:nucleoside deaminase [uncultured Neptuniibacter sp.]